MNRPCLPAGRHGGSESGEQARFRRLAGAPVPGLHHAAGNGPAGEEIASGGRPVRPMLPDGAQGLRPGVNRGPAGRVYGNQLWPPR